jgi:hypothetical protein
MNGDARSRIKYCTVWGNQYTGRPTNKISRGLIHRAFKFITGPFSFFSFVFFYISALPERVGQGLFSFLGAHIESLEIYIQ